MRILDIFKKNKIDAKNDNTKLKNSTTINGNTSIKDANNINITKEKQLNNDANNKQISRSTNDSVNISTAKIEKTVYSSSNKINEKVLIEENKPLIIKDQTIYDQAISILKEGLSDQKASFRNGQYEAIEAVFLNHRSLVVQKTGWGKSFVYFISTKINRNRKKGVSIVISPLLVLINNQIDAAKKFKLKCTAIYSTNKDEHEEIINKLKNNEIDILFITPESLYSILKPHLDNINIGMFIIDEVHCISDWGHDFRLSYTKISDIIDNLKNTDFPILGTTATASDQVIEDLKKQIGPNLFISRGPLYRNNLKIQVIDLKDKESKYAWIIQHINDFKGIGIIYCLTTRDCDDLSEYLNKNGVKAKPYHSDLEEETSENNLKLFNLNNENGIKVLISTIKLGMGYDKPDISFIIHYQIPKNIISYYQQIGRAARNIESGTCVLLKGDNDYKILEYFVNNSFPEKKDMELVLKQFENLSWSDDNGLSLNSILKNINIESSKVSKALRFLEFEHVIVKEKQTYYLGTKKFIYNGKHYDDVTKVRLIEMNNLKNVLSSDSCYSKEIVNALDDYSVESCGKCSNCLKKPIIPVDISEKSRQIARNYLNNKIIIIKPRNSTYKEKKPGTGQYEYPYKYGWDRGSYIPAEYTIRPMVNGVALSKYGDEGIGSIIGECKYSKKKYPDEVLNKAINILKPYIVEYKITMITFVPSLNNNLMDDFAERLADALSIKFIKCFSKLKNIEQKSMNNYIFQKENAKANYNLIASQSELKNKSIILIDDMIDSGYTISELSYKLMKAGALSVMSVALADSSKRKIDDE